MKRRLKLKSKIIEHVAKHRHTKKHISSALLFIIIAFTAVIGYVAGTYNYQIMAAIGPVFGYKAHSGSIDLSSVQETYNKLAANYDGTIDNELLIQGASRGLVDAVGDAYTVYMSPQETIDFDNSLSGNIGGGIGAVIGIKNGKTTIMSTLKDNPAIEAGLMADDTILKVNDESTAGWTVSHAVSLIRGDEGTTVKLNIQRGDEIKDYTIIRAIINNPSVISSVTDGIGTMAISRFDDETGNLARAAALDLKSQNVKAVILDLRGNNGGRVATAVDVASLWLDNKVIVTERTGDTVKATLKSGSNALLAGIPTAVLVDGGTASSSEIVAGALQEHHVAKLVGERTFGKGNVQQPIQLGGGAQLKVTIARWYTPDGKNITAEGIAPDTTVSFTQEDFDRGVDPQFDAAKQMLGL
ncbi:MAG TPA: S41 family peptidase [Candidatus Angelobacter sp.]|nr:S41 family peptidase [Candidatus Angelobacter sp.]